MSEDLLSRVEPPKGLNFRQRQAWYDRAVDPPVTRREVSNLAVRLLADLGRQVEEADRRLFDLLEALGALPPKPKTRKARYDALPSLSPDQGAEVWTMALDLVRFHRQALPAVHADRKQVIAQRDELRRVVGDTFERGRKKSTRRRRSETRLRPLTKLQREALELYGRHQGDVRAIAQEMKLSRPTVYQHLAAAWQKLPQVAPERMPRRAGKKRQLPFDRRGQVTVTGDSG